MSEGDRVFSDPKERTVKRTQLGCIKLAVMTALFSFIFALPGQARQMCAGGKFIKGPSGGYVGCMFETTKPWLDWDMELMCRGAYIFAIDQNGQTVTWICITPTLASQVQEGDWDGLSVGACTTPPAELEGWWPLNEPAGSAYALNPQNPSLWGAHSNGSVPTPGNVRNGLQMDGIDDYIEVADHPDLDFGTSANGDFTLAAWIKVGPNDISGVRTMIDKRQPTPTKGYSFFLYNGRPGVQLADAGAAGGYGNYIATPAVPTDGKWHLVAVSVSRANGAQFFIDAAPVGTFNVSQRSGSLENPSPLRIGSHSFSVSSLFRGAIDEVSVFRGALSEAEIQTLVNAGAFGMCKPTSQPQP
jgi:hypothetical protein